MADASYQKQHLAMHAAGFINALGTTQTTFGCQMTRTATGQYAMLLGVSDGLVDDESFTLVAVKGSGPPAAGEVVRGTNVEDSSNQVKVITVFDTSTFVDGDIEVALFKSVTH